MIKTQNGKGGREHIISPPLTRTPSDHYYKTSSCIRRSHCGWRPLHGPFIIFNFPILPFLLERRTNDVIHRARSHYITPTRAHRATCTKINCSPSLRDRETPCMLVTAFVRTYINIIYIYRVLRISGERQQQQ